MATRQIKDAKDLSTNELIYFKGHAQATFMSDGRTVEEAVNGMSGGSSGSSGSSGSVDTSNFVTSVKIDNVNKTPSNGIIDLGYVNKKLTTSTSSSMTLSPNVYYRNTSTSLSILTITLGSVSNSNIINEYFVEFTTRSSGTTVSLPSNIKWANGETPTFEASTTYQISIVNNLGTVQKFK